MCSIGCEGNCNIPTCTVNKPKYDVCNQGGNGIDENEPSGVIEYSYENCPLTDSLKTYSIKYPNTVLSFAITST